MENKQLEFKGKGFKAKAFDRDAAVQGLYDIARSYIPAASVHVDGTENVELWHRSRVKWNDGSIAWDGSRAPAGPVNMEVYYHSAAVLLPVFAHECGHLETMQAMGGIAYYQGGAVNKYKCEYIASCWALGYLRRAGMGLKEIRAAQALLQGCLDNYWEGCNGNFGRMQLDFKDIPEIAGGKNGVLK